MPMLSEHWNEGSYLPEGDHVVRVVACKWIQFTSGNRGIEFTVQARDGRQARVSLVLVTQALWKLAKFAESCGLSRDECTSYDSHVLECHQRLIGKTLTAVVKAQENRDGKIYHNIVDFYAVPDGADTSGFQQQAGPQQAAPPAARVPSEPPPGPDEDIPF